MKLNTLTAVPLIAVLLLWGCAGEQKPKEEPKPDVVEEETSVPVDTSARQQDPPAAEQREKTTAAAPKKKPAVEKNITIVGEVIDIVTYATSGVRGNTADGREIITMSAGGGNPMGILERGTGQVYVVTMKQPNTPANETLLKYLGMTVAASGDVYRRGDQQLLVMTVIGKSVN
jgi:hypothetical protein